MLAAGSKEKGGALRARIHAAQRIAAIKNQDPIKTEEVISAFVRNDTWQIPTLSIMTAMSNRHFLRKDWQSSFDYLPAEIANRWKQGTDQVASMEITEDQTLYAEWQRDIIKKMHQAGVQFMAGTDCPIFFLTPGLSLHEELALLVTAGFTPLEAIGAATIKPAQYFDMQDELGLIKEHMIADLLLLDANPLDDIRNTLSINTVIKNGRIQNRIYSNAANTQN
jgi:imidazolonepropionase-like amidohydrolase